MNTVHRAVLWTVGAFLLCGLCLTVQGEEKVIVSFAHIGGTTGTNMDYVVPVERFSDVRNLWEPNSETFSNDICRCYLIARTNAMTGNRWTVLPELTSIDIKRVVVPVNLDNKNPPLLTRAIISFRFHNRSTRKSELDIVMLRDGTVAELRPSARNRGTH